MFVDKDMTIRCHRNESSREDEAELGHMAALIPLCVCHTQDGDPYPRVGKQDSCYVGGSQRL